MTTLDARRAALAALLTEVAASLGDNLGRRLPASYVRSLSEHLRHVTGCMDCGRRAPVASLRWDHRDRATKYRTKSGRAVHPADMTKPDGDGFTRYSVRTILAEYGKCDVRCTVCDARNLFPESADGPQRLTPKDLLTPEGHARLHSALMAAGGPEARLNL